MKPLQKSSRLVPAIGILAALLGIGVIVFWEDIRFWGMLLREYKVEHRSFYSPSRRQVVTVVVKSRMKYVDPTSRKYVVLGVYRGGTPSKEDHVAFPPETGLVIIWQSDRELTIVTNQPPDRTMNLSQEFSMNIVVDNAQYERAADADPDSAI